MSKPILMPALSPTMSHGKLSRWLKKEGEEIYAGEVIAEIETDKALMEVEAVDPGILGSILVAEGTDKVEVGSTIAWLLEDEESTVSSPTQQAAPAVSENRVLASPLAKKIASQQGVELRDLKGSGPGGRIIKTDVLHSSSGKGQAPAYTVPLKSMQQSNQVVPSAMRRILAERLSIAKQTIPHFYLNMKCIVGSLCELRSQLNFGKTQKKISVNDLITRAVALAVRDNPMINRSWIDNKIVSHETIDLSIAVALEDGLITPIVRNAEQKSLLTISNEIRTLVERAKLNKLHPEEFQGGSITISNLGMYGVDSFQAIINPPQSCIIAVGGIKEEAVVVSGVISIQKVVIITLSCDHRIVDGAVGALFLQSVQAYLSDPLSILL